MDLAHRALSAPGGRETSGPRGQGVPEGSGGLRSASTQGPGSEGPLHGAVYEHLSPRLTLVTSNVYGERVNLVMVSAWRSINSLTVPTEMLFLFLLTHVLIGWSFWIKGLPNALNVNVNVAELQSQVRISVTCDVTGPRC